MTAEYAPLQATADATAYQRIWAKSLRARLAAGEGYAFVNADTPHEIFHALGMPVVVNQWWSSMIAAKQLAAFHLDRSEQMGFHTRLAKYSALPLFAALDGDPEHQPWGGLPAPSLLCARQSADDHQHIFGHWARLSGAPLALLSAPAIDQPAADWWRRARDDWETFYGSRRLDLLQAQIERLITLVEDKTGRRFDQVDFAKYMARIEEQERVFEEVSDMIAAAPRCPVRIAEMIPNVMIPQWHRGSDWALDHARKVREEIAKRIAGDVAIKRNEKVRMMWIGAGLWFDTRFYAAFEEAFDAVFAWSMYLPFAADGYIRPDKGDPVRALAARVVSMNEQLHQPPWAGAWLADQAKKYRIDMAVMIVPQNDRPSGYGTGFIRRAMEQAGVEVVELNADMVDARQWDAAAAKSLVEDGLKRLVASKNPIDSRT
ncbi:MAG: 2-hydroxyglutaryl-CoA dehydratase [Ahrensia sp.]|nr:2-hydroxyglutaryl-CoA dehydratase [Ahrensia sp.]|tara:strand:+ start:14491 stop:15783 length:1293 start_codon:yes stop_codon:yes gene_type:complete